MKLYMLLLFLTALALANIGPSGLSLDGPGAVRNTDVSESNIDFTPFECFDTADCVGNKKGPLCINHSCMQAPRSPPKRSESKGWGSFCRKNSDCNPNLTCFIAFCVHFPRGGTTCHRNRDCLHGVCVNGICIAPDHQVEAPGDTDPACHSDSECGGGYCTNGICVADPPSTLRFIRRSQQLICHNDHECDGGYCTHGICVADPPRLESRSPQQLICHNNRECDGGYCYHGICIADPPRLGSRSPQQLICHNNRECDGGYCYHGICVADPPNRSS